MLDVDLMRRKLSRLNMYLERLKPISEKNFEEYKSDFYLKFSAERLIQLIVECASDVNNHVVVETKNRPPEDYSISFVKAAEVGLISMELAEKLKPSGGMRNILFSFAKAMETPVLLRRNYSDGEYSCEVLLRPALRDFEETSAKPWRSRAKLIVPLVLRSRIVHEYIDIDDEKVYKVIPLALKDYKKYIKQVDAFIDRLDKI